MRPTGSPAATSRANAQAAMRLLCGCAAGWGVACLAGCASRQDMDLTASLARYEARFARGAVEGRGPQGRRRARACEDPQGAIEDTRQFLCMARICRPSGARAGREFGSGPFRVRPRSTGPSGLSDDVAFGAFCTSAFCASDGQPRRASGPDAPAEDQPPPRSGPGAFLPTLGRDLIDWPGAIIDDVQATGTSGVSWVLFAAAGAGGAALANTDADDKVTDHYEKHGSQLGSFADDFGEISGNTALHFSLAGSAYVAGLAFQHDRTYRTAKTMFNALALTGVTTLGLKAAVNAKRPNGDRGAWPSGHASSSFCFATVICHEYGLWPGAGAYALATFTAYQRIDSKYHHLSDVVSGALIGVAFGHAVAENHTPEILGMDVAPYVDPHTGAIGLALIKQW